MRRLRVWSYAIPRMSALVICAVLLAMAESAAGQIRGRITHAGTTEPVASAFVRLTGKAARLASSDASGWYVFAGLSEGDYCVLVDHPAYEPARACIRLGPSASLMLDLPLVLKPVVLAPMVVVGARDAIVRDSTDSAPGSSLARINPLILGTSAGRTLTTPLLNAMGEDGREMPGDARQHALYLWGTSSERGRVLLDGASVNAPLHLGTLLPPVDPEVLSSAAMRTGGISPRYDGGAAYIVEYTTRPAASRANTWGEIDLFTSRVGLETPLGERGRVLASGRRVNDESIDGWLSSNFGYSYDDLLARADVRVGSKSGLQLTTFATNENVRVPRDLGNDAAEWANRAGLLEWRSEQATEWRTATLSLSRGTADLPLLTAPGGHMRMGLARASGSARRLWSVGVGNIEAGGELEHLRFDRRARADQDPTTSLPGPVSCTDELPCTHSRTTLASIFGGVSFNKSARVAGTVGLRATYDLNTSRVHVLPRASVMLLPNARSAVTLSAGRFSQAQAQAAPTVPAGFGDRVPLNLTHATHVELGFQRHTTRAFLNASAYVRRYDGGTFVDAQTTPGGDVIAGYATQLGTISLTYTIGQSLFNAALPNDRETQHLVAFNFAGRHRGIRLDLTGSYGTGVPITSIALEHVNEVVPGPRPLSTPPTASFAPGTATQSDFRLDATLGTEIQFRRGDRIARLRPYVRIVNALSHRDALFYFQEGNVSQPAQELARLPTTPTIGLRWEF